MARLAANNGFALEVRHLSYWPDPEQTWLNYEFRFLFQGQPLFDPAVFSQNAYWGVRSPGGFVVNDYVDFDSILAVLDDALGACEWPHWLLDELDAEMRFERAADQPDDRWLVITWLVPRELGCGSIGNGPEFRLCVTSEQLQCFRNELAAEWAALKPSEAPE